MIFSFMSMHGDYHCNASTAFEADVESKALVAMRVHALHGGSKSIKLVLWTCWVMYAVATITILAVALWVRNGEFLVLSDFDVADTNIRF